MQMSDRGRYHLACPVKTAGAHKEHQQRHDVPSSGMARVSVLFFPKHHPAQHTSITPGALRQLARRVRVHLWSTSGAGRVLGRESSQKHQDGEVCLGCGGRVSSLLRTSLTNGCCITRCAERVLRWLPLMRIVSCRIPALAARVPVPLLSWSAGGQGLWCVAQPLAAAPAAMVTSTALATLPSCSAATAI